MSDQNPTEKPGKKVIPPKNGSRHWVFVLNWLTLGGAERQALLFADELLKRGHKVTFVGLSTPGLVQTLCEAKGIPCHYWPFEFPKSYFQKLTAIYNLGKQIKSLNPDYIAPYDMVPNLICALFWRLIGAKGFVWQQRDAGLKRRSKMLERLSVRHTPLFISNSNHAVEWMNKELGVPREKVRVVRNGVLLPELGRSKQIWRQKHGIADDVKIVTMVANLHHHKDHRTLVYAWKVVIEEYPHPEKLKLVFAGNKQSTWQEIQTNINELNLSPYVYAPGIVDDMEDLLNATDIVAFSSPKEGLPNAVLEGMAHGLPVVASEIPGVIETGIGHHPHQLFAAGNSMACASNILYFLNHEHEAAEAGLKNREIIAAEFGVDRMADETIRVFEAVHGI